RVVPELGGGQEGGRGQHHSEAADRQAALAQDPENYSRDGRGLHHQAKSAENLFAVVSEVEWASEGWKKHRAAHGILIDVGMVELGEKGHRRKQENGRKDRGRARHELAASG